ncbi:prepilin-type N-terminal cleavage/methylation domain-containing protein [Burkholderia sp. Ac-20379]|nr:prepilin-type N-terminal cleavage/methylation domain-containing protein [Burkholderia sp. Ac-20379]
MAGITLVESMVAIALLAIVATYASPSFVAWRQRDRVEAAAMSMLAALAAARVEAVSRGVRVALCRGDGNPVCGTGNATCDAGGAWSCGWSVVLADARAHDGAALRRMPAVSGVRIDGAAGGVVFTPPAGQVIGGFRRFEFLPLAWQGVVGSAQARCLKIAAGGRARVTAGRCGATQ